MLNITKGTEPACLAVLHATPDIEKTLNLNHAMLVGNRRQIVDAVKTSLTGADLTKLRAAEALWSRQDPRPEFAGVALPLIRRLIRRRKDRSARTRAKR